MFKYRVLQFYSGENKFYRLSFRNDGNHAARHLSTPKNGNIVAESRASTGLQRPGLVGAVTQRFNLCAACINYVKDSRTGL